MNHLSLTIGVTSLISLSTLGSAASAGTLSFSDSIPMTHTDYSELVSLPMFDSSQGILNSVELKLEGMVEGDVFFENQSNLSASITTALGSSIELQNPDATTLLLEVLPLVTTTTNVTAYDGVVDFAGTSGKTFLGETMSANKSALFNDASNLALFTGSGNIDLPVLAVGKSEITGPGNLSDQFNNLAAAKVTVTYNFTTQQEVPESSAILGMSAAVAVIGSFASKRRFKQA